MKKIRSVSPTSEINKTIVCTLRDLTKDHYIVDSRAHKNTGRIYLFTDTVGTWILEPDLQTCWMTLAEHRAYDACEYFRTKNVKLEVRNYPPRKYHDSKLPF